MCKNSPNFNCCTFLIVIWREFTIYTFNRSDSLEQGFHKLFAYGCPDRKRELGKKRDKNF